MKFKLSKKNNKFYLLSLVIGLLLFSIGLFYYLNKKTEPHFGIRTYDHKLIYYNKIDQWEFYDLNKDRAEMFNQYNNPAYQTIVSGLKEELVRLQDDLEDNPKDDGSNPNISFFLC